MGRAGGRGGGGGGRGGSFGGSRGGSFGGGRSSSSFGAGRSSSGFGRSSSGFGSHTPNRSYNSGSRPRHTGGYTGGLWGMPRTTGPIIINNSGNNNRRYTNSGNNQPNYSNNTNNSNNSNKNTGTQSATGCLHVALIIIMIISLLMVLFNSVLLIGSGTQPREKLKADISITEYYTDELNWINNPSKLEEGLEYFYEKTGVQPYLYITDDVGGDFYDVAEEFANAKYDELFTDEAHVLLLFWEQDYYCTFCLSGSSADTVIDSDARNIILNKIDEYYWDSSLDEDEFFSKAFSEAADEIMAKPSSGFGAVAIPFVIFVAALAAEIAIRKKEKRAKKDAELKEMLEKPLETFGSTEAADLAKKYENTEVKPETSAETEQAVPQPPESAVQTQNVTEKQKAYIYCSKCGSKIDTDSVFCSNCGEKLAK